MSVRFSGEWLELIEAHIKGLAGHFEATSRQLTRLDAVDEQLRQLSSAQAEQLRWSQAQPSALREDAIAGLIDTAAERAASRLAAALPAPAPATDAEGSKRIDALERVMQDYIAERRRGEEAASGMLHTIEETLIRVLDRIDAMESGAAPLAPDGNGNPPGRDGMDAESDRLAEAYAAGARILGQKPPLPTLDAADYVPPRPLQEESPAPAAGRRRRRRVQDAPGFACVGHARQAEGAGRPRGADHGKRHRTIPRPRPTSASPPKSRPGSAGPLGRTCCWAGPCWPYSAPAISPSIPCSSPMPRRRLQQSSEGARGRSPPGARRCPIPASKRADRQIRGRPAGPRRQDRAPPRARAAARRARHQHRRSRQGGALRASGSRAGACAARHDPAGEPDSGKRRSATARQR